MLTIYKKDKNSVSLFKFVILLQIKYHVGKGAWDKGLQKNFREVAGFTMSANSVNVSFGAALRLRNNN